MRAAGSRVRAARMRARLSQHELARRIGASQGSISEVESGRKPPGMPMIERIAKGLGVAPADLLLDGPHLLEVVFECEAMARPSRTPWMERKALASVPESIRGRVAVWPYRDDNRLRFRVLASSVPAMAAMAGTSIDGIAHVLPPPIVRPIAPTNSLEVLYRANDEDSVREKIQELLGAESERIGVTIERSQDLWLARLEAVPQPFSLEAQSLSPSSPVGLFVPV